MFPVDLPSLVSQESLEVVLYNCSDRDCIHRTLRSLERQSDGGFSVALTASAEAPVGRDVNGLADALEALGIANRIELAPSGLSSLEELNLLQFSSRTTWLKPLCAGDLLEPTYVARWREAVLAVGELDYFQCAYWQYSDRDAAGKVIQIVDEVPKDAECWRRQIARKGLRQHSLGALAYRRDVFASHGGLGIGLPNTAEAAFTAGLLHRFAGLTIREPLVHVYPKDEWNVGTSEARSEKRTALGAMLYQAWTEGCPQPHLGLGGWLLRAAIESIHSDHE